MVSSILLLFCARYSSSQLSEKLREYNIFYQSDSNLKKNSFLINSKQMFRSIYVCVTVLK